MSIQEKRSCLAIYAAVILGRLAGTDATRIAYVGPLLTSATVKIVAYRRGF